MKQQAHSVATARIACSLFIRATLALANGQFSRPKRSGLDDDPPGLSIVLETINLY
jgi:hypothetical protein